MILLFFFWMYWVETSKSLPCLQGSRAPVTPSEMPVPTFVSGALKIFGSELVTQDFGNRFLWFCSSQLVREWCCVSTLWKAVQWRKSDCLETTLQIDRGATVMLALSKICLTLLRPSPTMAPEDFGVVGVLAWIEWWETCREMECNWRIPSKLMVLLKIQKSIYPPEVYIYKAPTKNSGFFTTCTFSPVSRRISAPSSLMSQGVNCFLLWGNEQIKRSTVGFSARIVFGISWVQRWIRLQHFCGEATNMGITFSCASTSLSSKLYNWIWSKVS